MGTQRTRKIPKAVGAGGRQGTCKLDEAQMRGEKGEDLKVVAHVEIKV